MTHRKTASTITDPELTQMYERLERAEQELRHYTEAESADAAAGSYAGRAEHAETELAALRKRALTQLGELGIAHHRLDRIRDAARLHRQHLISLSELYATIEALDSEPGPRLPDHTINEEEAPDPAPPVKQRADCTELEWAEQERARFERLYTREYTRADQAEELLQIAHDTSNRSETERARAVQRAEQAERDARIYRDRLARLADGYAKQLRRLEAVRLAAASDDRPVMFGRQPDAEVRAELEQAQAALERMRAIQPDERPVHGDRSQGYRNGWNECLATVRRALDGAPSGPTATEGCAHCGHPADWHDPWEGCVGPNGIGGLGSGDCTCTRSPAATRATDQP